MSKNSNTSWPKIIIGKIRIERYRRLQKKLCRVASQISGDHIVCITRLGKLEEGGESDAPR